MKEPFQYSFSALGSLNEVTLYHDDVHFAQKVFTLVEREVQRIERKYSRYLADSIISEINQAAGKAPIKVDPETARLIDFAFACYHQSNQLFDFTSGVLRRVWNFKQAKLPEPSAIAELLSLVGSQHVVWKDSTIFLTLPGMEIDFGGFGKEYATDQALGIMVSEGVNAGYVNLGGDLRVIGLPPERSHWTFGIAHPRIAGEVALTLDLATGALTSSGDYERYFEIDGKRYCHILNPRTGYPVTELQSVSVVAPATMLAGSCSTIAMLLGKKKGATFLKRIGYPYVMIDHNGSVIHG